MDSRQKKAHGGDKLKKLGFYLALLAAYHPQNVKGKNMDFKINTTLGIKLNVRPVTLSLYHNYVFEGPCRFEEGEKLKKEHDLRANDEKHKSFIESVMSAVPTDEANILEPIHFQYDESFLVTDADLDLVGKDSDQVDLYIFKGAVTDLLLEFPRKYKKPMIVLGRCLNTVSTASLLARGYEVYPCQTIDDAVDVIKALRVRKALSQTRVLAFNRLNSGRAPGMIDAFLSLDDVSDKLGVRFIYYNIHEFFDQLHNVPSGENPTAPGKDEPNINDTDETKIKRLTNEFIEGAEECDMTPENVYPSLKAHYLINKLMEKTGCNAFTAPCFDICATRRFNEEKFTFCLNHSLNNENGIPSSCEYDIPALLSMVMLSNTARSAPYMGNTITNPIKNNEMGNFDEKEVEKKLQNMENLVLTWHSVPNRKLKGFDKPNGSYAIRSFAYSGWGATIRYNFNQDKGQPITMCRIDPTCGKLFIARGTVVCGIGYDKQNCTEGVIFQVVDSDDFFDKLSQVGNHTPLVYGDCFNQMVRLGKILGFELLTV